MLYRMPGFMWLECEEVDVVDQVRGSGENQVGCVFVGDLWGGVVFR